ncbi:MAG: DinB family protein [Dehalococcoidia bacterium]|nr:DinB family protein [Dehalococcoidia bacterium]
MLPEVAAAFAILVEDIEVLLTLTDGRDATALNWRPAPAANSLFALATHTIGAAEQSLITTLCGGRPTVRDRDAEFAATGDSVAQLRGHWDGLRHELAAALERLPAERLDATIRHPRLGDMSGHTLLLTAREHLAHAGLTAQLLDA